MIARQLEQLAPSFTQMSMELGRRGGKPWVRINVLKIMGGGRLTWMDPSTTCTSITPHLTVCSALSSKALSLFLLLRHPNHFVQRKCYFIWKFEKEEIQNQ